ncbi:hypothetical protein EXW48_16380 [Bacillus wiedmannii]|nr:hypothetical protein EXW48_16380 [Bacillus wiedmannii]
MPSSDLNHHMYWTPIQILFYHVKLYGLLRKKKKPYIRVSPSAFRKKTTLSKKYNKLPIWAAHLHHSR